MFLEDKLYYALSAFKGCWLEHNGDVCRRIQHGASFFKNKNVLVIKYAAWALVQGAF